MAGVTRWRAGVCPVGGGAAPVGLQVGFHQGGVVPVCRRRTPRMMISLTMSSDSERRLSFPAMGKQIVTHHHP